MHLRIALTACLWVLLSPVVMAGTPQPWRAVTRQVDKIKREPSGRSRTNEAEALADLLKEKAAETIPDSVLADITSLMSDRDDSVRYWTAMGLGFLGPQAAPSIPALERALKQIEHSRAAKTSASAIRLALTRIRGTTAHWHRAVQLGVEPDGPSACRLTP